MKESSEQPWERSAKERNQYISFFRKYFHGEKVSAGEVMRDEADRLNQLVDTRVSTDEGWTSHQEAADDIVASQEFQLEQNRRVVIREFIKQTMPQVDQQINHGNLKAAIRFFYESLESEASISDQEILEKDFFKLYLLEKLESLATSHDQYAVANFYKDMKGVSDYEYPKFTEYAYLYMPILKHSFEELGFNEPEDFAELEQYYNKAGQYDKHFGD